MGSKGHSKFEEIIIGSNTEKIVRSSKIPVIVVKRDSKKFSLKKLCRLLLLLKHQLYRFL